MKPLAFDKMEGLGNDFVVIDCRHGTATPDEHAATRIAHRRNGIGCDQVLLIHPPRANGLCRYTIRNADGSPASQCGNGARCIGWWLFQRGEFAGDGTLESPAGPVRVTIEGPELVRVSLQPPAFPVSGQDREWASGVRVDGQEFRLFPVDLGNPHAVVLHEPPTTPPALETLVQALDGSSLFPDGVNLGLARVQDRQTVVLVVHERGAGPTRACGSGACATASALIRAKLMISPVSVVQPGGSLVIEWPGEGSPIQMTGPARWVFKGEIEWQNLTQ